MPKRPIEQRRMIAEGPLPEFPANLLEFQRMFPDEAACLSYMRKLRWPSGFICESCVAIGEPFTLATRPRAEPSPHLQASSSI